MNNTLTFNNPLSESDWDKICDVEFEKTKHIWYKTPSGKRVDFIRSDVLDKIRAEITDTLYVDSLIFGELIDYRDGKISTDDVIEEFNRVTKAEVLKIIDKYKAESER